MIKAIKKDYQFLLSVRKMLAQCIEHLKELIFPIIKTSSEDGGKSVLKSGKDIHAQRFGFKSSILIIIIDVNKAIIADDESFRLTFLVIKIGGERCGFPTSGRTGYDNVSTIDVR